MEQDNKSPEYVVMGIPQSGISEHISHLLAEKGMNDVIVVDASNVSEIGQQMRNKKAETAAALEILMDVIPPIGVIQYPDMPYKKTHKPNKGIKLGSYRYKSKKTK